MHNFRELKIWHEAMNLSKAVYKFSSGLPADETYGLKSQINRSAVSIPSNIAESSGRNGDKQFSNFLSIAQGSSYELETQILLASDLFGLESKQFLKKLNELQKMMAGFKRTLDKSYV